MYTHPDMQCHPSRWMLQAGLMEQSVKKTALPLLHEKIKTIQTNLTSWTPVAWLMYWGVIPLTLFMIWSLSPEIKSGHFILDTTAPHWTSIFLSSYTHSGINHLGNNIGLYLLALTMIFTCCRNPKLLHYSSLIMLIAVPFFTSAVTMHLSAAFGQGLYSQGFSAVAYAYAAFGLYSFFSLVMPKMPPLPFERGTTHPYPKHDIVIVLLIITAIVFVLAYGLTAGEIVTSNGNYVNGPAHVIGFFSGIITISLVDLRLRTNSVKTDSLFILIGAAMLAPYLLMLQ